MANQNSTNQTADTKGTEGTQEVTKTETAPTTTTAATTRKERRAQAAARRSSETVKAPEGMFSAPVTTVVDDSGLSVFKTLVSDYEANVGRNVPEDDATKKYTRGLQVAFERLSKMNAPTFQEASKFLIALIKQTKFQAFTAPYPHRYLDLVPTLAQRDRFVALLELYTKAAKCEELKSVSNRVDVKYISTFVDNKETREALIRYFS